MKKLLLIILIIEIVNLVLIGLLLFDFPVSSMFRFHSYKASNDTIINKTIIDSILFNINQIDSTIITIKENEKEEINKANNLNNDSAIMLFKELVE